MRKHLRRAFIVAAVSVTAAAFTPAGVAGGLLSSGSASSCDEATQAFARWGDSAYYMLLPGGSFEAGSPAWALSGGAKVVPGNEPFYLRNRADQRSLVMPAGSVATSPTICFAFADWHLRFVTRNGTASGSLKVEILVPNVLGVLSVLDGGYVTAGSTWRPSPKVSLLFSNPGGLLVTKAVAFRFRATKGSSFQLDDVYLDPWKRT